MGKQLDEITPELRSFIEEQPIFFVSSAPLAAGGHVNLSPKGLDTFRVLGPTRVAYLDLTGSGNETAAHVAENGRLTIMFCAFAGSPRIVRLYCRGRVVSRGAEDWDEMAGCFPELAGVRQVVVGEVELVQTSCGYGVPEMALVAPRDTLTRWAESKGEAAMAEYRRTRNRTSLDGLEAPGLDSAR